MIENIFLWFQRDVNIKLIKWDGIKYVNKKYWTITLTADYY